MVESPPNLEPSSSYQMIPSPIDHNRPPVQRSESDSDWDVVEDLPLRWATDFVNLAAAGSRLVNVSVSSYDLWHDDRQVRGGTLLAIATKTGVLLYESPKGERAFKFVKVSILVFA